MLVFRGVHTMVLEWAPVGVKRTMPPWHTHMMNSCMAHSLPWFQSQTPDDVHQPAGGVRGLTIDIHEWKIDIVLKTYTQENHWLLQVDICFWRANRTVENNHLKIYLHFKMVIFHCHFGFRGCTLWKSKVLMLHGQTWPHRYAAGMIVSFSELDGLLTNGCNWQAMARFFEFIMIASLN